MTPKATTTRPPVTPRQAGLGDASARAIAPSPLWTRAMPPGPDVRVKITREYARHRSLTIYVQAEEPSADRRANWLPAPAGKDFSLYLRAYWPKVAVTDGSWTPPAVQLEN